MDVCEFIQLLFSHSLVLTSAFFWSLSNKVNPVAHGAQDQNHFG